MISSSASELDKKHDLEFSEGSKISKLFSGHPLRLLEMAVADEVDNRVDLDPSNHFPGWHIVPGWHWLASRSSFMERQYFLAGHIF